MIVFDKYCTAGMLDFELRRAGVDHDGVTVDGCSTSIGSSDPRVADVVRDHEPVAERPADLYDCRCCGACCVGVDIPGSDLLIRDGQCRRLIGSVGGPVSCSEYEARPDPCRSMRPGSVGCQILRVQSELER